MIIDFENKEGPRRIDITVAVTDGKNVAGDDDDAIDATIVVHVEAFDVDEKGHVSLHAGFDSNGSYPAPRQGAWLTANLNEPDRMASKKHTMRWKWETSADKDAADDDWSQVGSGAGAQYSHYRPTAADEGKYLRAVVTYEDLDGVERTEQAVSTYPVLPPKTFRNLGLTAKVSSGAATLSWNNPNDSDIVRYEYLQSTGNYWNGEWADIPNSDGDTTQFTITGLENGVRYFWIVSVVHKVHETRLRGDYAGFANAIVKPSAEDAPQMSPAPGKAAPAPLKRPLGMRAQPGNGSAALSWNNPDNSSIIGYEYAWYSENSTGISAWEPIPDSDADTTEFTITGLENGVTYIYFIRAVDENGPGKVSAVAVTPNEDAQTAQNPARIFICLEEMIGRRLYNDCSTLLSVKDALDREGVLNWSVFVPIKQWDGITVKGTPKRVKRIDLPNRGLVGSIPEDLARLNKLTHLNLKGNSLTDDCTPKTVADGLKVAKPAACSDD